MFCTTLLITSYKQQDQTLVKANYYVLLQILGTGPFVNHISALFLEVPGMLQELCFNKWLLLLQGTLENKNIYLCELICEHVSLFLPLDLM